MRADHRNDVVHVYDYDIAAFSRVLPGLCGLKGVRFGYDRHGLVSIDYHAASEPAEDEHDPWDTPALAALSQDAEVYLAAATDKSIRQELRRSFREEGFPWWWPEAWGGRCRR